MEEYIKFEAVGKLFPGQRALHNVSFSVRQGEIHALLGENGAGKSTLLNILHGVFPATEGKVFIDGKETHFSNAFEAIQYGIAKVHQEINLIPELTVAQNVMLGHEDTKSGLLQIGKMNAETDVILKRLGCTFSATDKIRTLSTGKKQMVQIARALRLNAKIISLDEPTASLSDGEVSLLFKIIEDLKSNGITILYITHKMDEVFKLCDRATVLRDGKYVGTFDIAGMTEEALVQSMVGRDVSMFARRLKPSCANMDEVVMDVRGLRGQAGFRDIGFQLHRGEILGFFGLVGAMRTEVMRGVFGADPMDEGTVTLDGAPLERRTPYSCVRAGIGLISENRKEEGFVNTMSNAENIGLASVKAYQKAVFVLKDKMAEQAKKVGNLVGLTPNQPEFMTMNLSGGNIQKVILAKWLSTNADILILDEPTKGIDIGAKAEIYKLMEELVSQGKSIIMISSELTEAIGLSDRIIIMREGHIVAELQKDEFAEERIITLAVGG